MKISPNYKNAASAIPPGIYRGALMACQEITSASGTRCLKWKVHVTEGDYAGKPLSMVTPIEGEGAGFLYDLLRSINSDYTDGEFDVREYLNRNFSILVKENKSQPRYPAVEPLVSPNLSTKAGE